VAVAEASEVARGVSPDEIERWVREAARAASSKSGEDIVVLEVGRVASITSWFVITSGRNPRQVKALVEEIEERVAAIGGPKPLRIEGLDALEWVLMDYGDFVVHVFVDAARRLWGDVPRLDWADPATEPRPHSAR
jgi:ribosome-associated protein